MTFADYAQERDDRPRYTKLRFLLKVMERRRGKKTAGPEPESDPDVAEQQRRMAAAAIEVRKRIERERPKGRSATTYTP